MDEENELAPWAKWVKNNPIIPFIIVLAVSLWILNSLSSGFIVKTVYDANDILKSKGLIVYIIALFILIYAFLCKYDALIAICAIISFIAAICAIVYNLVFNAGAFIGSMFETGKIIVNGIMTVMAIILGMIVLIFFVIMMLSKTEDDGKVKYLFFIPVMIFVLSAIVLSIKGYSIPLWILAVCSFLIGFTLWTYIGKPEKERCDREKKTKEARDAAEKNRIIREQEEAEKQKETEERNKEAERIRKEIRRRVKNVLRNDPGESYSARRLRSEIGIDTASEDAYFQSALDTLPYSEGFRNEGRRYNNMYYYVNPD